MLGHAGEGAGAHRMLTIYQLVQKNLCILIIGVAVVSVGQLTVLPTPHPTLPNQGNKLTRYSLFWFNAFGHLRNKNSNLNFLLSHVRYQI